MARAERALVAEVVDGENGARLREQLVPGVSGLQQQRREGGVPVVTVHDVGREAHALAGIQRGAR